MRIRHVNNCRAKTDAKIFPNKTNPTTFPSDFWRSLQPLFDPDLSIVSIVVIVVITFPNLPDRTNFLNGPEKFSTQIFRIEMYE